MTDSHSKMHYVNYTAIFVMLCVFTGLSWLADEAKQRSIIENKIAIAAIVLAVASAKALFVMAYFMHLKFEGRWKYLLLAPTVILAMGLPLALLPDIGVHYYTPTAPQIDTYRETQSDNAYREVKLEVPGH
jgi:cytochrome c oxidase subunit 4